MQKKWLILGLNEHIVVVVVSYYFAVLIPHSILCYGCLGKFSHSEIFMSWVFNSWLRCVWCGDLILADMIHWFIVDLRNYCVVIWTTFYSSIYFSIFRLALCFLVSSFSMPGIIMNICVFEKSLWYFVIFFCLVFCSQTLNSLYRFSVNFFQYIAIRHC